MSIVVNTNISSLNAQRNLTSSGKLLSQSLQRLSSGLRINSAKDDTAGLAISDRMNAQVRGLNQAARNANDGISLAQTAEGALGEITNNLQRIRELAIQSANATNTGTDRASLDAESSQLISEITRVATQTQFNGLSLLDGNFTNKAFQVGANANQTISISSIANAQATALGSNTLTGVGSIIGAGGTGLYKVAAAAPGNNGVAAMLAATNFNITTVNGGTSAPIAYAANSDAKTIAAAINNAASGAGITATATNTASLNALVLGTGATAFTMTLNGAAISATVSDPTDLTNLMGAINGAQATTGVTATFTSTSSKAGLTLTTSDGRDIVMANFDGDGTTASTINFGNQTLTGDGGSDSSIKSGVISLASTKGSFTLANAATDVFTAAGQASAFSGVATVSLTTDTNAQAAISVIDAALGQIDSSRGELGAIQNRFESTIANLMNVSENISAAKSRIVDADFATETASLTKSQILQQAGLAMLSQANQVPQAALTLLK